MNTPKSNCPNLQNRSPNLNSTNNTETNTEGINNNGDIKTKPPIHSNSLLETIFGSTVSIENLPQQAILKSLDLKIEQEKTKQQYYKLENIAKSIELFRLATSSGLHSSHIFKLFDNSAISSPTNHSSSLGNPIANDNSNPSNNSLAYVEQEHPNQPSALAQQRQQQQQQQQQQQMGEPQSYKFPPIIVNNEDENENARYTINSLLSSTKTFPPSTFANGRTNSPARIGAHAVAVLNEAVKMNEYQETNDSNNSKYGPKIESPLSVRKNHNYNHTPVTSTTHTRNSSLPALTTFSHNTSNNSNAVVNDNNNGSLSNNIDLDSNNTKSIPPGMVSILSFHNTNNSTNMPKMRKSGMINKKHRRVKSTSSQPNLHQRQYTSNPSLHKMNTLTPSSTISSSNSIQRSLSPHNRPIDLNVINNSGTNGKIKNEMGQQQQDIIDNNETCSENSSRAESPLRLTPPLDDVSIKKRANEAENDNNSNNNNNKNKILTNPNRQTQSQNSVKKILNTT
ncbi:Bop3p NDAI_0G00510 [Naumovozyma dairenensis CBS 421]|uniref:Uncharacterized protein n=1 Tax=Naumovozyma dairenensis (strain ATCC 10597 / BCRC 20456 / CBS 421 / NBRC 0211 / NRRL Y-12639) TaxID=1071378 RepID=G0WDG6_NAUDC|nr:hypothetical protein NDAI_0G00510 [Naumovozyma dairenensis CBS 421]CCD25827.2 hypothetical protein NDAI_0G00510 [Naumovozyma dairenensis CBS 421]